MKIIIYSKPNCTWCVKTKELLRNLHLQYDEKVLGQDYDRDYLRALIGEHKPLTVPQVFVDNKLIGGYEDFADWCDNRGLGNVE